MNKFVVIGNPIAHSQSPRIHTSFAEQCNIQLEYERMLVAKENFETDVTVFFKQGCGANVTVPFKENAFHYAEVLSKEAQIAGAVNTLSKKDGVIHGDNTDGIGLVRDIRDNHAVTFHNKRVLLIGAGGAAKGVMYQLLQENPQTVCITNRTIEKADKLANTFSHLGNVQSQPMSEVNTGFDIIINATSSSLSGGDLQVSTNVFQSDSFAYDMMYALKPTAFMQTALSCGAHATDGLGMLVEQAAESFRIWHQVMPKTNYAIDLIRKSMQ